MLVTYFFITLIRSCLFHTKSIYFYFFLAESLIKEKLEKIHSSGELAANAGQEEAKSGFLQYVLANNKLSDEEVLTNTTELLLSGVDTVIVHSMSVTQF